ncbi:MAG: carboxypeptidase regulatory-like domain-containing protein, partial [Gemmatimonadales bacterium]
MAIALGFTTRSLAAQETVGKIEGTVTDQAGVPIATAQVFIVGTAFSALTTDKGYYFFNNVPAGLYTVRSQFIGYAPAEVRGVRVQGGQTITADVRMQSSAIVVTGITVTAAENPLVPRDQVTSKVTLFTGLVRSLPVDDVRGVLQLAPGVVETNQAAGVSIRGGRPGEANVYIDGAPVRGTNSGGQRITV